MTIFRGAVAASTCAAKYIDRGVHRVGGEHQLGDEILTAIEEVAARLHASRETVHDRRR